MWVLWEVLPQQWMEADHGPVIKPRRQASGGKGQHPTTPRDDCLLIDAAVLGPHHLMPRTRGRRKERETNVRLRMGSLQRGVVET
jgi:hypothetical protein